MTRLIASLQLSNPLAAEWLRRYGGQRIKYLSPRTQRAVHDLLLRLFQAGRPPREMAGQLAGVLELEPRRIASLALQYDTLIRVGLTPRQANTAISVKARRMLASRAMLIARTETQAALNGGQLMSWLQAMQQGLLDPRAARREWVATLGLKNTCLICRGMHGRRTTMEHPWMLPNGVFTQHPPAHPNCRCRMRLLYLH